MSEQLPQPESNLPSGYKSAEWLPKPIKLDENVLPWLKSPLEISVSRCELDSGTSFYVASAISSHDDLVEAAKAMTKKQKHITDNMFYSRLAGYVENHASGNVETFPRPSTPFAIHVMRNNGGQRVYFGEPKLKVPGEEEPVSVFLRLATCDKNGQGDIFKVLTGASQASIRRRTSK
jgi:hypothetical protein